MSEMFDFGNGPVPAHQHPNGGGWVAATATVAGSAHVGPNACVLGNACVYGDARILGDACVYGDARVFGDARVYGNARVNRGKYTSNPVSITRSDGYTFTLQADGGVIAGCRDFTREQALAYWNDPSHHKHEESMAILTALYAIGEARK